MFKGSLTDSNKKYNLRGPIVKPGKYSASLYLVENGETTKLSEKKIFELKPIYKSILKGTILKIIIPTWMTILGFIMTCN